MLDGGQLRCGNGSAVEACQQHPSGRVNAPDDVPRRSFAAKCVLPLLAVSDRGDEEPSDSGCGLASSRLKYVPDADKVVKCVDGLLVLTVA